MEALREIIKVKNNKIQLMLPENYENKNVEVIVLPLIGEQIDRQDKFAQEGESQLPEKTSFNIIQGLKEFTVSKRLNRNELKELIEEGRA